MTKIYLVRHAEAEGNLYRRIHGQYDSLVTDNGYRQIAALAHRFEDIHVDAVYSSDLFRTRTTAKAIYGPKGLPLTTRKSLREVSMGVWEDRTWGEVARTDAQQLAWFNTTDRRWKVEGGESFAELRERISAAIRQIAHNHPGETVAVVSHGTAIRNALAVFQGLSIEESASLPHSDNTAVSLLEFDGDEVRVVFHDDGSHLPEEISTFAKQRWWKQDTGSLADANMWFRPLDMEREADFYRQCPGRRGSTSTAPGTTMTGTPSPGTPWSSGAMTTTRSSASCWGTRSPASSSWTCAGTPTRGWATSPSST